MGFVPSNKTDSRKKWGCNKTDSRKKWGWSLLQCHQGIQTQ